jgi:transposase
MRFVLAPGQARDVPQAGPLIEGMPADVVIADTAYDADHFRLAIARKGALAVIRMHAGDAAGMPDFRPPINLRCANFVSISPVVGFHRRQNAPRRAAVMTKPLIPSFRNHAGDAGGHAPVGVSCIDCNFLMAIPYWPNRIATRAAVSSRCSLLVSPPELAPSRSSVAPRAVRARRFPNHIHRSSRA